MAENCNSFLCAQSKRVLEFELRNLRSSSKARRSRATLVALRPVVVGGREMASERAAKLEAEAAADGRDTWKAVRRLRKCGH